jgi:hypothetical protein
MAEPIPCGECGEQAFFEGPLDPTIGTWCEYCGKYFCHAHIHGHDCDGMTNELDFPCMSEYLDNPGEDDETTIE